MRLIDADILKDTTEYAILASGDENAEKWAEWFNQVIDTMPTVCDNKQDVDFDE